MDVGQGDGIWIHTFDDGIDGNGIFEGRNIVIDGGPNAADHSNAMLQYLEEKAHHNAIIYTLICTHAHDDHYPGSAKGSSDTSKSAVTTIQAAPVAVRRSRRSSTK